MEISLNRPKLKKGFTFVELVVSIAILGILAMVAVPAYMIYTKRAAIRTTESNLEAVKTTLMSYHSDVGDYPKALEDLVDRPKDVPARKWNGPYFDKGVPKDGWNHELEYQVTKGAKHPYELFSWGPAGVDSEDGQISVWEVGT